MCLYVFLYVYRPYRTLSALSALSALWPYRPLGPSALSAPRPYRPYRPYRSALSALSALVISVYLINNNPFTRFRKSTFSKCALINSVYDFIIVDGAHFEHVDFGDFLSCPEWTDSMRISPTPRLP